MRIVAVIPARMASSRFPGKPMALINGMPMIGHCYSRIRMCAAVSETYVATCDQKIYDYIESINGKVVMTNDTHDRASDRAAEAMLKIEESTGEDIDILVMVQGDEPMDTPDMVNEAIQPMLDSDSVQVVNLMARIETSEEFEDPNVVKVVVDKNSNAIYFSREPIPSRRKGSSGVPMMKQVCVIPFRRNYLLEFNKMPETDLERIESIDMLRIIENGDQVQMVTTQVASIGVDTKEDLVKVSALMSKDKLVREYFP